MKDKPIDVAAREVAAASGERCSESALRRLERKGVVRPTRDPWGRRLFGADDIAAARDYLTRRRAA